MANNVEPLQISINLTLEIVTIVDPNQSPQYAERGEHVVIYLSLDDLDDDLEKVVGAYNFLVKNDG